MWRRLWITSILFTLGACTPPSGESPSPENLRSGVPGNQPPPKQTAHPSHAGDYPWHYSVSAAEQLVNASENLHETIVSFLQRPSGAGLNSARNAWHRTHNELLQLYPLFYAGRHNPQIVRQIPGYFFLLEQWPVSPGYLDAFGIYTHSGIINDLTLPMNAATLREQHGLTDSSEVVLGLHGMEYLLWGEDSNRGAEDFIPPELTPAQKQAELSIVDLPASRRSTALHLQSELLLNDAKQLEERMTQPGSTMVSEYQSLGNNSQVEFWRGGLVALLQDMVAGDDTEHQPFAGHLGDLRARQRDSLQHLLFVPPTTAEPSTLGQALLTADELQRVARHLSKAKVALENTPSSDLQPPPQAYRDALAEIILILDPLATSINSREEGL